MTFHNSSFINGPASTAIETTALKMIIDTLAPELNFRAFKPGSRFTMSASNQSTCYIVRSGIVTLHRQPDDILIEVFEAPTLRGVIPLRDTSQSLYVLKSLTAVDIAILDKTEFYRLLSEYQLWEIYARHLESITSIVAEVIFKLTATSSIEIVLFQLIELMNKPEEIRTTISAEEYIRGKTRLSRSGILRILSDLKAEGCVVIEKTFLKEIRFLPQKK